MPERIDTEKSFSDPRAVERAFIGSAFATGVSEFKLHAIGLTSDDFIDKKLALIYKRLEKFVEDNKDFDIVILGNELKELDALYLMNLLEEGITPSRMGEYASQIRENALRRRLVQHMSEAHAVPTSDLVANVQSDIWDFQSTTNTNWDRKERIAASLTEIEKRMDGTIEYSTGLVDVDMATGGLQRGDVIIMAGRPGHGKTAISVNWCDHLLADNKKILYIDLETSDIQMIWRFMGLESEVPVSSMKSGLLTDMQLHRIVKAASRLEKQPLTICDNTGLKLADIVTKARALDADLIVVDYINLMAEDKISDNNTRIERLIRGLKMIAKDLNIPVLVLSQLNRKLEDRTDRRPQLADLRDSGALEQVGDVICAMYWEYKYDEEADPNQILLRILKQKTGEAKDIKLNWTPTSMKVRNYIGYTVDEEM